MRIDALEPPPQGVGEVLFGLLGLHPHTVASASAQLKVDYAKYVARRA